MRLIVLILCFAASSVFAQCKQYFRNTNAMYILRETPIIDNKYRIVQNGRDYIIEDSCFGRFTVLSNNSYCSQNFYLMYDKKNACSRGDRIFYFNNGVTSFNYFNCDSFLKVVGKKLKVPAEKIYLKWFRGNDTMALFYIEAPEAEFRNSYCIYQYSLKENKVTKLIYSMKAYSLEMGMDPVSKDFKLGILVTDLYNSPNKLIVIDILSGAVVKEISNINQYSFTGEANILITTYGSVVNFYNLETNEHDILVIKGKYWVRQLNWLHGDVVYLQIQRRRWAGERYKLRDVKLDLKTHTYKKCRIRFSGIIDM